MDILNDSLNGWSLNLSLIFPNVGLKVFYEAHLLPFLECMKFMWFWSKRDVDMQFSYE